MICEKCKAEGYKSTINIGEQHITNMPISQFFDEEGARHVHDPNTISTSYRCSRGHAWTAQETSTCPCGWPAPPETQKLRVIANGKTHLLPGHPVLSFEDVVRICVGTNPNPGSYTVTFRAKKSEHENVEGILSPGHAVQALEGMVFNAYITGNA